MSRRGLASAAASLAVAVVCAAGVATARERPAELGRMAAAGAVQLSSPSDGHAVLDVRALRPGQSVSGTVTLANVGDAPGRLTLAQSGLLDVPGRGGGLLSRALRLRVEDAGNALLVYDGAPAGLGLADLGTIADGESRAYRFTATLPDQGRPPGPLSGDNAFQGASMRVDWTWGADSPAPPVVPPTTTPVPPVSTPAPPAPPVTPPAPPVAPPAPQVVGGSGGAPRLVLRIPRQRVIATRGITLFGTCDEPCGVRFAASIATAPKRARLSRVLMRRKVFRGTRVERRLAPGAEKAIKLKLTRRGLKTLKRTLRRKRRAAVTVIATVRGSGGVGTVRRRIVLVNRGSTLRR
jgi:hypothetical protein